MSVDEIKQLAAQIRIKSLGMVHRAKASHIGSALSIADILAVLYGRVLIFDSENPEAPHRDRFILSKGHACVALYAALSEVGFIDKSDLDTYGEDYSKLMNHVSHAVPGVEFSTGSLGHGLPFAVGKAKTAKMKNENWNTFVLLSDGEVAEGSNWEALLFAAHHNLDNLMIIVDYNKIQSMTTVKETLNIEPLGDKFAAFGCETVELDGHNLLEMTDQIENLKNKTNGKPKVVIAHTTKGKGVSFMENKVEWHYKSPNDDEYKTALREIFDAQ
jgi:transketolase